MNSPLVTGRIAFSDPFFQPFGKVNVGFDQVFDKLLNSQIDVQRSAGTGFPPHNIIRKGNDYLIELAIAGFEQKEIDITVENNKLIIKGRQEEKELDEGAEYLHQGISARDFEKTFFIEDHVIVHSAKIVNGLLSIQLEKEIPESAKPRKIEIKTK
jgi:molecular chaperone IbpA